MNRLLNQGKLSGLGGVKTFTITVQEVFNLKNNVNQSFIGVRGAGSDGLIHWLCFEGETRDFTPGMRCEVTVNFWWRARYSRAEVIIHPDGSKSVRHHEIACYLITRYKVLNQSQK